MPLMEVIESVSNYPGQIIERVPEGGEGELKWGAQLTVRDYQWAVFYRDGQALEVFEGGRHILTTQNIPVLTKLVTSFGYGEDSPFRSDVLFIQRKLFTNIKWGTSDPIVFRDPDFQLMRLRSYGTCAIRVADPILFVNNLVGAQERFDIADISDYVRQIIASSLAKTIGALVTSILELPNLYSDISSAVMVETDALLSQLGLEVSQIIVNSINPPDSVQEIIDKRTSMSVIGDMAKYLQFQTANALLVAAENSSGAGEGVGLGAGLGLGLLMPQGINAALNSQVAAPPVNESISVTERLVILKGLIEQGLIDQATFERKRDEILSEI